MTAGAYIALHAAHRIEKEMHVASKESPSDAPNIVQVGCLLYTEFQTSLLLIQATHPHA